MAQSDVTVFMENLKMWDRPPVGTELPVVLRLEDNVDKIVDEMFDNFCDLQLDRTYAMVGNC
ncbi:MAG TPA: hypothetical protein VM425_16580 [Myxococcota bacterium]|nr:hypothetical protein [Myxococcota bacterium]